MIIATVDGANGQINVSISGPTNEVTGDLAAIFTEVFNRVREVNHTDAIVMAVTVKKLIDQCDPLIRFAEALT